MGAPISIASRITVSSAPVFSQKIDLGATVLMLESGLGLFPAMENNVHFVKIKSKKKNSKSKLY